MTLKNSSFWILVKPEKADNPGPDSLIAKRQLKPRSHRPVKAESSFSSPQSSLLPTTLLLSCRTYLPTCLALRAFGFLTLALIS